MHAFPFCLIGFFLPDLCEAIDLLPGCKVQGPMCSSGHRKRWLRLGVRFGLDPGAAGAPGLSSIPSVIKGRVHLVGVKPFYSKLLFTQSIGQRPELSVNPLMILDVSGASSG